MTLSACQPASGGNGINSSGGGGGDDDDDDKSDYNDTRLDESMKVYLQNHEIRSVFGRWLRIHITNTITARRSKPLGLFRAMVSKSMSLFAEDLGNLLLTTMPGRFLGSKEDVYQAYLSAYLVAAAEAMAVNPKWEVEVERYAGVGRLDLIAHRVGGKRAVIKRI